MKKITRNEIIYFSLSIFFVLFTLLVSFGLDNDNPLLGKDNFFALLVKAMGFTLVKIEISSWVVLGLILIYFMVATIELYIIREEAIFEEENPYKGMWLCLYIFVIVFCLLMSFGIGTLLLIPYRAILIATYKFIGPLLLLSFMALVIVTLLTFLVLFLIKFLKRGH